MTAAAPKLIDDALALPSEERARVAAALLASLDEACLDGGLDADPQSAWAAEAERRARRVVAGGSAGASWDEVRRRLVDRLARR